MTADATSVDPARIRALLERLDPTPRGCAVEGCTHRAPRPGPGRLPAAPTRRGPR